MDQKKCFVAMPIKAEGTEEYSHFRAIYEQVIKPTLERMGFIVVRADEIQKTGAITRDIVLELASADLVVVDLTDLNPNVFYELGVRHALRAKGTVMMLDEIRTTSIPFDLGAYRVIQFKGDLTGIGKLSRQLELFASDLGENGLSQRDNPVHDWIPSLPLNIIEMSKGSVEGELRERLAQAEQKIRRYEQAYGKESVISDDKSPMNIIMNAFAEAEEGFLPLDLMKKAELAARERDIHEFLAVLRKVLERGTRLSDDNFRILASHANNLGLSDISGAIYDHALQIHPKSRELRRSQLVHFAHSEDPATRARARQEILKDLDIVYEEGKVVSCPILTAEKASLFGVMLDAFHDDSLDEQALEITQSAIASNPASTIVLRNHARALERVKNTIEAFQYYQQSIMTEDADDASMTWFGNTLHNEGRYIDAIEVYLLACLDDPDDASGFSRVAEILARAMIEQNKPRAVKRPRRLPQAIATDVIQFALIAASSCRLVSYKDIDRIRRVIETVHIDGRTIDDNRMTLQERVDFASQLYKEFESELTNPSQQN